MGAVVGVITMPAMSEGWPPTLSAWACGPGRGADENADRLRTPPTPVIGEQKISAVPEDEHRAATPAIGMQSAGRK
jgi:hypothetical protein